MKITPLNFVPNTVTVDLEITNMCQFKCPYCEVWKDKSELIIWNKKQIDHLIDDMAKCRVNIIPTILGGEPTLHPKLNYIIERFDALENVPRIIIVSNAVKNLSTIKFTDKVDLAVSYHTGITKDEVFYNNISHPNVLKHLWRVMFLLTPKYKQYKDKLYNKLKTLKKDISIEPRPLFLIETEKYFDSFLEEDAELIKDTVVDGREMSYYDMLKIRNNFKGMMCYPWHIQITADGELILCPYKESINVFSTNFFENFKPEYSLCESDKCLEDCFATEPKYDIL
jgi:hypothetical protein